MSRIPVGEIRPSQLLWTYGPGALIDLPNLSVVTMGLDRWERERCRPIREARLLAMVRALLGPQVEAILVPPSIEENVDPFSAEASIGAPVRPFPRWMRCVRCGLLSPYDAGLFVVKEHRYRPERTRVVHQGCKGSRGDGRANDADAVPARFLLACPAGHLDDFPWHWFVHGGPSDCAGTLRFFETGASLQTENLWVRCDTCGSARSMAQAFGRPGRENLPACRGRHPHLDGFDDACDQEARTILLGATNSWFPVSRSILAIPETGSGLPKLVADGWPLFEDVESADELVVVLKVLKKSGQLVGIEQYEPSVVWEAIEAHRRGATGTGVDDPKGPEWEVLTSPTPPTDYPHFLSKDVGVPSDFRVWVRRVLALERLREVNALVGFTRVESPEERDGDGDAAVAPLALGAPTWVLGSEVHGEGVFVQFDGARLRAWEEREPVKRLEARLRAGHVGWRRRRGLDPALGFPGARYVMLHTLAHLLIRELALECGYNAASIRERIYADVEDGREQGGILVYTAAADADGTLGGLVELSKPANLGRLLRQALERAQVCSSDPLCAEHDPGNDQSLHGASCHACSFASETSCERSNRYLERALVVPTIEMRDAAFFDETR